MNLPDIFNGQYSELALQEGQAFFQRGSVLSLNLSNKIIVGRILVKKGKFETVKLTLRLPRPSLNCTCGINMSGVLCSHAVAALLSFRQKFPEQFHAFAFNEESCQVDVVKSHKAIKKSISLKDLLLENAKELDGFITVDLQSKAAAETRWHKLHLEIALNYKKKRYSCSNLKSLLDNNETNSGMKIDHFPQQDRAILRIINELGQRDGNKFTVNAHEFSEVLQSLILFPRFFISGKKAHVHESCPSLELNYRNSDNFYIIEPQVKLPGLGQSNTDIDFISGKTNTWLSVGQQIWMLPSRAESTWISQVFKSRSSTISREEFSLLSHLVDKQALPLTLIEQEGEASDDKLIEKSKPVAVLTLDWIDSAISTRMQYEYNNCLVKDEEKLNVDIGGRFVERSLEEELQLKRQILLWGFEQDADDESRYKIDNIQHIGNFLNATLPELDESWKVYYSPKFRSRALFTPTVNLEAQTVEENRQWVDLELKFSVDSGQTTHWQELLSSINNDEDYIQLKDGSIAKIDDSIKKILSHLPEHQVSDDGHLRFSRYMSIFMKNLLGNKLSAAEWTQLEDTIINAPDKTPKYLSSSLKETLREYQKDGIAWIQAMHKVGFNCILADEMGLGKTIQTLSFLSAAKKQGQIKDKALIVCPKSLIENWASESQKFTPELKVMVIHGNEREGFFEQINNYDLIITSYSLLRRDVEYYKSHNFDFMVLDEAQNIKNHRSQTAKACRSINAYFKLILSGTPVENSINDIWALFDFLLPGLLGNQRQFKQKFLPSDDKLKLEKQTDLAGKIKPFILRRLKESLLEQLPPKQEQIIYCELNDDQKALYAAVHGQAREFLDKNKGGLKKKHFDVLAVIMKLRQICCFPQLLPELREQAQEAPSSAKMELLREIILESIDSNHRMLLFSQFTSALAIIRTWLENQGIPYEYLDGSTQNRLDRVNKFNESDTPIFLLSLKAGGTGLNLTGADTVIHFDQWWNPMVEDQATDRVHRIGQTKSVTSIKLVARNTIEEKILSLQDKKRQIFQSLFDGAPEKLGDLSEEDLEFLLE